MRGFRLRNPISPFQLRPVTILLLSATSHWAPSFQPTLSTTPSPGENVGFLQDMKVKNLIMLLHYPFLRKSRRSQFPPAPTKMNGEPDCVVHHFWMQKSCPSHEHDGTHYCFSCHRREPRGTNYSRLDDSAMICPECLNSSITDTEMCQPLFRDIQAFYKDLNMNVDQTIEVLLVDRGVLLSGLKEKQGYHSLDSVAGRCRYNTQTDQIKYKRPKITILLRKGLPRILTGMNLAHEMMHAWLHLNGYVKLAPLVEEGICVVMSHMWLDLEMKSGSGSNDVPSSSSSSTPYRKGPKSQFERKLAKYCLCNLEVQPSPIYGDGFRLSYAAVKKYGLKSVLDHIKLTGNIPAK